MNNEKTSVVNDLFKGFALFTDIEDEALRARNRAVVLTNMALDHTKNQKISPGGAGLMLGYFRAIPEAERAITRQLFKERMKQEGFHLVGN